MILYICNSLSLSMLDRDAQALDERYGGIIQNQLARPRIPRPVTLAQALILFEAASEIVSAIGHADTAAVLSGLLGAYLAPARVSVHLQPGERALIGQYVGPRMPEGCTTLPPGASIEWWTV